MLTSKQLTEKEWLDAIQSSIINNNQDYTTPSWMRLETCKSNKKVKYELNKLCQKGLIQKTVLKEGTQYRLIK